MSSIDYDIYYRNCLGISIVLFGFLRNLHTKRLAFNVERPAELKRKATASFFKMTWDFQNSRPSLQSRSLREIPQGWIFQISRKFFLRLAD